MNRAHSGNRSVGKTNLTRDLRSMEKIELKTTPLGERRRKTLEAKSGSFDEETTSIQLEHWGGDVAEESFVKPKSLRMRVGKVMEKKWRD